VSELDGDSIRERVVTPDDFGLPRLGADAIAGADAASNAKVIEAILRGEQHPARGAIVLNAAAAVVVAQKKEPKEARGGAASSRGLIAMGILRDILAEKAKEAAALQGRAVPSRPAEWPPRDVVGALARPAGAPLRLIAEIKFRSPSAGNLSRVLGPRERATAYQDAGASMVSVLTDQKWFDGSYDDLTSARSAIALPVLCKDFVIHAAQVDRAVGAGADALTARAPSASSPAFHPAWSRSTSRGSRPARTWRRSLARAPTPH
jgi:hypothetical protein